MRTLTGWLLCLLCVSCAVDQHFEFPVGPQGPKGDPGTSGLSAYEVWLDFIQDNPDYMGGYTEADFFLYLKGDPGEGLGDIGDQLPSIGENNNWWIGGEDTGVPVNGTDGADGTDGTDGTPGLTAYEVWVGYIANGDVEDPHNPGTMWPANQNTEQNFWRFLTGAKGNDGLSAYDLWVIEVGKGLDHPQTPGSIWPKGQTRLEHFWKYLRGADGKDGGTFVIEKGVYNVIAQYQDESAGEFVRTSDGSVVYYVYNKNYDATLENPLTNVANLVPHAKVSKIRGLRRDTVLVADANGRLIIPKDLLPRGKAEEDRFGSCFVAEGENTPEETAINTYVPEKIDIRMRLRGDAAVSLYNNGTVRVHVQVERRTELNGPWERMPVHLIGGYSQNRSTYHYFVSGPTDHAILDDEDAVGPDEAWGNYSFTISATAAWFELGRPRVHSPYLKDEWVDKDANGRRETWNGTDPQYMVTRLESYYGEKAQLVRVEGLGTDNEVEKPVIIQRVPIQYLPIINEVSMGTKEMDRFGELYTMDASGSFDLYGLNYDYFFEDPLKETPQADNVLITPVVMDPAKVKAMKLLRVHFTRTLTETDDNGTPEDTSDDTTTSNVSEAEHNAENAVTLGSPGWSLRGSIYDQADVYVYTTDPDMFSGVLVWNSAHERYDLSNNTFRFGKMDFIDDNTTEGKIIGNNDDTYNVPEIPVVFAPQP